MFLEVFGCERVVIVEGIKKNNVSEERDIRFWMEREVVNIYGEQLGVEARASNYFSIDVSTETELVVNFNDKDSVF